MIDELTNKGTAINGMYLFFFVIGGIVSFFHFVYKFLRFCISLFVFYHDDPLSESRLPAIITSESIIPLQTDSPNSTHPNFHPITEFYRLNTTAHLS
jgi:hypothetical protein